MPQGFTVSSLTIMVENYAQEQFPEDPITIEALPQFCNGATRDHMLQIVFLFSIGIRDTFIDHTYYYIKVYSDRKYDRRNMDS